MKKLIILIVSFMVVLSSCNLASPVDVTLVTPGSDLNGVLNFNFVGDINSRGVTITPGNLDVLSYHLVGREANGYDTFDVFIDEVATYQIPGLLPGTWSVIVDGYDDTNVNLNGTRIATDSPADFEITSTAYTSVNVELEPLSGTGTFSVDLAWNSSEVTGPTVEASLMTLDTGTPVSAPVFTINASAGTAVLETDPLTLDAGYYILLLILRRDGTIVVSSDVTVVRIIQGQISDGSLFFNLNTGGIDFAISENLHNSFDLVFTGYTPTILYQTPAPADILNVLVDIAGGGALGDSYQWFLNGSVIADDDSTINDININSDGRVTGLYNLTAVVTRNGGASSNSLTFSIAQ